MKRVLLYFIFFIIIFTSTAICAVEVEPSKIELSLSSGETSTTLIKVTNWLDYNVKISVKAGSYRYILTDNSISPADGKEKLPSCEGWLKFEPNEFELSSRASMYIKCAINVPKNASKEHLAAIVFDEEGLVNTYEEHPTKPGNITLQLVPRFTIPLYITIKGNEVISAEISDMKVVDGPAMGTIKTEITLHNNGTVHMRPSGNLIFMDSKENVVKTMPIGECLPIFPDYKEKVPVYYPELLEPGIYTAICTISIGGGKLLQKKASFRINEDYELE